MGILKSVFKAATKAAKVFKVKKVFSF